MSDERTCGARFAFLNEAIPPMNGPRTTTEYEDTTALIGRTFRTVGILVAVTVLFVGALSAGAVLVTSKAVGAAPPPAAEPPPSAPTTKKPLSI